MKSSLKITFAGLLLVGAALFYSCSNDNDDTPVVVTPPTLYQKLGGTTMVADPNNPSQMIEKGRLGLRSVVDSTIFVIAADPQLQPYFSTLLSEVGSGNTTNLAILSKNLTDFFCVGTGAKNFTYSGLNMVDAHNPATNPRMAMKANNADMDKFIGDVVIGAQKNNVPNELIGEVGTILESLRPQVVQQ
ncbi:group 1 truncated hemoglobin [Flavobacterium sp. CAU 1735]|uniref:group I truncated hemoglobin n=1 Tax=Flavobacterium sp. CAU 1735 TaxID=3140361 RepID=UPI003261CF66